MSESEREKKKEGEINHKDERKGAVLKESKSAGGESCFDEFI